MERNIQGSNATLDNWLKIYKGDRYPNRFLGLLLSLSSTYLFRVLGDMGRSDLVDTMMMQPDYPSFYNFIKLGLTTIAERWRSDKSRSMNHDMYAGILEWYYRSVAGISNIEPGYKKIQIKPAYNLGLSEVECSYVSIREQSHQIGKKKVKS